ncbi:hypothetical protein JRO89_XS08G0171400 [Xanthoceras sorbifolium]|uniref:Synechocystis YCF37 n=1 Tax=Xanthoceras sorbifolium TaxID=99658 RepID=A0ABQ8HQ66_9ROSI|nr:hypothetical protein JRO89_XS08G0171400 [Xanthoceras sorbifolium]
MASTISSFSLQTLSLPRARTAHAAAHEARASKPAPVVETSRRKLLLFSLTVMPVLTARESACFAQDIPLFGLRKNLRQAEKEAVEFVKEAERDIETAEKGIEAAEIGIESEVGFGGLAQAGAVAGAEVVGVLVATAVVNGILGPQK